MAHKNLNIDENKEESMFPKELEKNLSYWKANAEEDYKNTPISVLKYISELENLQNISSIPVN